MFEGEEQVERVVRQRFFLSSHEKTGKYCDSLIKKNQTRSPSGQIIGAELSRHSCRNQQFLCNLPDVLNETMDSLEIGVSSKEKLFLCLLNRHFSDFFSLS